MRKHLLIGIALASALAVGTSAVAFADGQPGAPAHHGWHGHGHDRGGFMALHQLNLTDAQKASVKQIMHSSFAQNKGQRDQLRQQRSAFEAMTPDQPGYQSAAARLAQTEAAATQARVVQRANVKAQIYAVLTPAQKAQLATLKTQHEARREQWKQFRAEHPVNGANTTQ